MPTSDAMGRIREPVPLPCGATLGGRVMLAPLTNLQSQPDGTLGEDELRWLVRRAEGGFPLTSTCAAYICEAGKAWTGQLGVAEDRHLPGLSRLAAALRDAGTTSVVQLHHAGQVASCAPEGHRIGPTDNPERGARAATRAEIEQAVQAYASAAVRAEAAGFDGVEVHGANGYLLTQFLAPLDNLRTDDFGGDIGGRARLIREVLRAVRTAVSPGFIVGVRLSPIDVWSTRGLTLGDSVQVARWLAEDGADFVHLSLSDATVRSTLAGEEVPVVRAIRDHLPSPCALVAAGGITSLAGSERVLDLGADMVAVGRAGIIHPDWPRRLGDGGFAMREPPWPQAALREAAVGEAFVQYLLRFPGLVEGGAPPRS